MSSEGEINPEEILHDALHTLYDYQPITLTSFGTLFSYDCKLLPNDSNLQKSRVVLHTPDTHPSNWSLHASSIWASSQYVADHIDELGLDSYLAKDASGHSKSIDQVRVLELGAGAGLPGIVIAKTYPDIFVTCSDYPDEQLIETLTKNIATNEVSRNCRAKAYAWGSDPKDLLSTEVINGSQDSTKSGFDVIVAADTLWNPDLHGIFIDSLKMNLRLTADARIHLIAGLHTGRYTLQKFLENVSQSGLEIESIVERETMGNVKRPWDVSWAEKEDEKDRRRWVVWTILKWSSQHLDQKNTVRISLSA
ncbi:hypothetical protein K435DRAFT_775481 [Dendrothele bispora CBS 962.96]|uniref:Nicotinamide N-methyltransferase n=1 Tax=Dendrothele bispora (strain CBS 962.96) TaxID=1314807 RepID=A0A4S8MID8_DENBC|nr:hypothetical protein K435DRAFT_775481 [Dendrothele bispora CBS 962.96]